VTARWSSSPSAPLPLCPSAPLPLSFDPDLLDAYDFVLPPERIADSPAQRRDAARLLTLNRETQSIGHRTIRDLPDLLRSGDLLVLNETRVLPARLQGVRTKTGGKWEGLFLATAEDGAWRIIGKTRGRLLEGESITIQPPADRDSSAPLTLKLESRGDEGEWRARPNLPGDSTELLEQFGSMPLPPYIHRDQPQIEDRERYQTVYARTPGAVAAPTAGLHFTDELLRRLDERGIARHTVTLHVGAGTFVPIKAEDTAKHRMHAEWGTLSAATADALNGARAGGGRIVAIGTTSLRLLESAAREDGTVAPFAGETDLFITPGYRFRAVDALMTNFHLPRSTLFMLVSAFAGLDAMQAAYALAISHNYRFYSYGDACLLFPSFRGDRRSSPEPTTGRDGLR
jgi:S-adenosylmethionine:tRNA ribosyltransferase-isomerase